MCVRGSRVGWQWAGDSGAGPTGRSPPHLSAPISFAAKMQIDHYLIPRQPHTAWFTVSNFGGTESQGVWVTYPTSKCGDGSPVLPDWQGWLLYRGHLRFQDSGRAASLSLSGWSSPPSRVLCTEENEGWASKSFSRWETSSHISWVPTQAQLERT